MNRYELLEKIGAGGMGEVYRAHDRLTGEIIALKRVLLQPKQIDFQSRHQMDDLSLALAHEFRILASLRHPHIISVLDYGFEESRAPYFTMELLESPRSLLNVPEAVTLAQKVQLILDLLQGLAYLHQRGILHRDLKPSNVLVANQTVKIIDFGLAIHHQQFSDVAGTLPYIAPELLEGENASVASDLYGVGLIIYQLFARRSPFNMKQNTPKIMEDILLVEPDFSVLPPEIAPIVRRLMSKKPQSRYASAEETTLALSKAIQKPLPPESEAIRESFLQSAPFVGRETELTQLRAALRDAQAGQGSMWLVSGESGVGKSRLLDELRIQALVDGIVVLTGQAHEFGGIPYQLWREPLRRLVVFGDIDDEPASVLKTWVADLEELLGRPIPDAPPLSGDAGQHRLAGAIHQILKHQNKPVLLVMEDLQWADESLELLRVLMRSCAELPLLIVGTYRSDEKTPQLAEMNVPTLHLERFEPQEINQLLSTMIGRATLPTGVYQFVEQETAGNVFFIVEIIRALAEESGGRAMIGAKTLPSQVFARGLRSILQRRLAQVPTWGQALLEFAAVVGRHIQPALLTAWQTDPSFSLEEWLIACAEVGVLELHEGSWRFPHDKLRAEALAELDPLRKQHYHLEAARIYEEVAPNTYAELAYHYGQGQDTAHEKHYAYLAGRDAALHYANNEALRYLGRALELTTHDELNLQWEILQLRERVYHLGRQRIAQFEALNRMTELANRLLEPGYKALLEVRWAEYYEYAADYPSAERHAQAAFELAEPLDLWEIQARALFWWARAVRRIGRFPEARQHSLHALEIAQREQLLDLVADSLRHVGYIYLQEGELIKAQDYFAQSLAIAQATGNRVAENAVRMTYGELMLYQSNALGAVEEYQIAYTAATQMGDRWGEMWALFGMAIGNRLAGEVYPALQAAEAGLALSELLGDRLYQQNYWMVLGFVYGSLGEIEKARRASEYGLQIARQLQAHVTITQCLGTLAELAYLEKDYPQALQLALEAEQVAQQAGLQFHVINAVIFKAAVLLEMGELNSVEPLLQTALAYHTAPSPLTVEILGTLATLQWRQGRETEARTNFDEALAQWQNFVATNTYYPGDFLFRAYRLLKAWGDPRLADFVKQGQAYLRDYAARIPDEHFRQSFGMLHQELLGAEMR